MQGQRLTLAHHCFPLGKVVCGATLPNFPLDGENSLSYLSLLIAFVYGFRWVMLLSAILALASALSAWLMIDDRPGRARPGHGSEGVRQRAAADGT